MTKTNARRSETGNSTQGKVRREQIPPLGARFEKALVYATRLHARQTKKGGDQPYVGHLLGVAALVIAHGGDEDQAIAALLHDAVEDQGGLPTLREIRRKFGRHVATIVEGCSDSFTTPKPPWKERKSGYIAHVRHAPADVRLVSTADKLDNIRAIVTDLRRNGDEVWSRFKGGKDGSLWYYREMFETLKAAGSNPLVEELGRAVAEMERLAARRRGRKRAPRKAARVPRRR
jgi:(p)ppGpp synthase/HD superfamily hydrolase